MKKRNKKYRPKPEGHRLLKTQPWKVAAVFNPLTAIIDQLEEQGTKDVAKDGNAIFKDAIDGNWFDTVTAVNGVIEAYEIHETRAGVNLDMDPLRLLVKKLQYDMPIFDNETRACRECLERMKAETMKMTADYARQIIVDFQIKEKLQQVAQTTV